MFVMVEETLKGRKEKREEKFVLVFMFVILTFAAFVLLFTAKSLFFDQKIATQTTATTEISTMSGMALTSYDKELGRELMDTDHDGKCDACGMPVEMCLDTGQLQCNMGSASTIGILDSQHIHADFKVYINGQALDFANPEYYMKSSFLHVDDNQNKDDASGILHMHATGVPLWIFFESIGMALDTDCFTVDTGEEYCTNTEKSLKFYVNSEENTDFEEYVFTDGDKILISYGDKGEDVSGQVASVTDFAQNH